jgi:hypothetical protein
MKINLIEVPTTQVTSFILGADIDRKKLIETKTIRIQPHRVSKTRVATSMQIGDTRAGLNLEIEGYKQHSTTEMNYFSGNRVTKFYYVKSKKQNLEDYKEYVKKLVVEALKYIHIELDEITIELETAKF